MVNSTVRSDHDSICLFPQNSIHQHLMTVLIHAFITPTSPCAVRLRTLKLQASTELKTVLSASHRRELSSNIQKWVMQNKKFWAFYGNFAHKNSGFCSILSQVYAVHRHTGFSCRSVEAHACKMVFSAQI